MNYKFLLYTLLISTRLFSNTHSTKQYNFRDEAEHTHDAHAERQKEQERREQEARERELAEELKKQKDVEIQKSTITINAGLVLLNNKEDKTAIAVFEIPKQSEQYILSDAQKERAKKMFDVYASHNSGPHKIVRFKYADSTLLPQTKEQAIFLLYSPYIKMSLEELKNFSGRTDCPLNEAQKKVIYEKMAVTKAIIDRAKEEYEKSKQSNKAQSQLSAKEGLIDSTLVKTDKGHCRIEDLKVGQVVCCYDTVSGKETYSKITHADKIHLDNHIQIIINDESIRVAPNHKFYVNSCDAWIKAEDLKDNAELRELVDPRIQNVKEIAEALDVIRIGVDGKHNFYISNHNILVHNYIPIVFAAKAAFELGEGIVWSWAFLQPTLTAAAHGLVYWVSHKVMANNHNNDIIRPYKPGLYNSYAQIPIFLQQEHEKIEFLRNNNQPSQKPKENNNNDNPQDPNKNKNDKDKKDLPEKELLKDAKKGDQTNGSSKIFEKEGGDQKMQEDFDKTKKSNIRPLPGKEGKLADLDDGRRINIRKDSTDGRSTLEIYDPKNGRSIKIRYNP